MSLNIRQRQLLKLARALNTRLSQCNLHKRVNRENSHNLPTDAEGVEGRRVRLPTST